MSGNPNNVDLWAGADVIIGDIAATIPAGGADFTLNDPDATPAVTTEWDFGGIVDPGGFTESQSNDSTDVPGWGFGVVATARKNLAVTVQATLIEDNDVTRSLRYDTSDLTTTGGNVEGDLKGRDLNRKLKLGLQVQTGNNIRRRVTKNYAQIDSIGDWVENEDGTATTQATFKIYPDASGAYWHFYDGTAA